MYDALFFSALDLQKEKKMFCTEYLYDDIIAEEFAQNVVVLHGMPQNTLTNPQAGCAQPMYPGRMATYLCNGMRKSNFLSNNL